MAWGPGRYDDLATFVREAAQADGAVVIVVNGSKGDGFSAQLTPEDLLALPERLRDLADQIDQKGPGAARLA